MVAILKNQKWLYLENGLTDRREIKSWVDGFKSPAGLLPVHRDQLRTQRWVTSMGSLYLFTVF